MEDVTTEPVGTEAAEQTPEQIAEQAAAEIAAEATTTSPKPGTIEYTKEVQKRINTITREKHDAIRERDRLKAENESLKRQRDAGARPVPPDPSVYTDQETGRIDSAKYQTVMKEHEDKLHIWRQAQGGTGVTQPTPAEPIAVEFFERAEAMKEKPADFEEVVNRPVFTPALAEALFANEQGPQIAYLLGNNEAEAKRIGNLPPAQMMREIGKLEARFSAPGTKLVSGAPAPITPVIGPGAGPPKDPEKMSTAEWMEWNRQQELNKVKKRIAAP